MGQTNESTLATIGRGFTHAPALRRGLGLTVALAVFGTGTRVVVPILIQLTIDTGFDGGRVQWIGSWCCAPRRASWFLPPR